jgi:hypothetical protein
MSWQLLILDDRYEINTEFPYKIRKRRYHSRFVEDIQCDSGSLVKLSEKLYQKARVVMGQFKPPPAQMEWDKLYVYRVNRDPNDYHLDNLEWMTPLEFAKVKKNGGRERDYLNELPDDAVAISHYRNHQFDGIYVRGGVYYQAIGSQYRALPRSMGHFVKVRDIDGVEVNLPVEVHNPKKP